MSAFETLRIANTALGAHQVWLDALQRNGQWAVVQNVLQPMVNAQRESVRLARQAGVVNGALGLAAAAHSTA